MAKPEQCLVITLSIVPVYYFREEYDPDKFKLYFFDTGLFAAMPDDEAQEDLRAIKNLNVCRGALYEKIVGEALVKSGCPLVYYKREDSILAEDFLSEPEVICCRWRERLTAAQQNLCAR